MSRTANRPSAAAAVRLPLGEADIRPTFRRERAAIKRGVWPVAGCDEAGRGPLAGPVVAGGGPLQLGRGPFRRVEIELCNALLERVETGQNARLGHVARGAQTGQPI